jgi:signal peptidase I
MGFWKQSLAGIRLIQGTIKPETRHGYTFLCVALWSVLTCLFVQNFIFTTVMVEGKSMMPTLKPGDGCMVNCWLPRFRAYNRGDIVVIHDPFREELMAKRIIALAGDRVQLRGGRVYVNGQLSTESYLDPGTQTYSRQLRDRVITVGANSYFVMGDNRAESEDSRYFGDIYRGDLVGLIAR